MYYLSFYQNLVPILPIMQLNHQGREPIFAQLPLKSQKAFFSTFFHMCYSAMLNTICVACNN